MHCFLRATPHKARLTALHAICVQIFRHIAQKSLAIRLRSRAGFCPRTKECRTKISCDRQYACGISGQSAEKKSDNAPYAQALCGVALATFSIIQHFSQIEKRVFWKFFQTGRICRYFALCRRSSSSRIILFTLLTSPQPSVMTRSPACAWSQI